MKARRLMMMAGAAFLVLVTCTSFLALEEIRNFRSVHPVYAGRPVTVWLEPGVYNFDQDPGTGSGSDPKQFSVTGGSGPVEITGFWPTGFANYLGVFIGTTRFSPVATFRIGHPGNYTITLQQEGGDLQQVLVTDPYAAMVERAMVWGLGALAAFVVLLFCLVRAYTRSRRSDPS